MPRPRKHNDPETHPKKPTPGRRNRRRPAKQERALPDRNSQEWAEANKEPGGDWGENDNAWAEAGPTGWGEGGWAAVESGAWGLESGGDWALEAYTTKKIEIWRQQVKACPRHELVRTPSATSSEPAAIDERSLELASSSHPITSKFYRWALNFLNQEKVSADRKRRALSFLKRSRQQQLQCIRRLIEEIRES
ncbi:hypothetical protein RSOLAG1IB_02257 [Rhizoctonia solani AG-1 IB]|uniref:Uncharacterized protein n=1 Tax=Thanatephorus cucumeris (strain AG1-IB / isolate 7/3/14) TaxID=1108050 RepID=A0A0B7FHR1_THACB|nr:hypothetical protein RSOLAG1IB_02257 [Rhizoctonia solani AG-1 IB]